MDRDELGRKLYDIMERMSDEAAGPPWDSMLASERDWYCTCASELAASLIADRAALIEALEYLVGLGGGDCLDPARTALAKARGEA